jgi:hypothetical protein
VRHGQPMAAASTPPTFKRGQASRHRAPATGLESNSVCRATRQVKHNPLLTARTGGVLFAFLSPTFWRARPRAQPLGAGLGDRAAHGSGTIRAFFCISFMACGAGQTQCMGRLRRCWHGVHAHATTPRGRVGGPEGCVRRATDWLGLASFEAAKPSCARLVHGPCVAAPQSALLAAILREWPRHHGDRWCMVCT